VNKSYRNSVSNEQNSMKCIRPVDFLHEYNAKSLQFIDQISKAVREQRQATEFVIKKKNVLKNEALQKIQ